MQFRLLIVFAILIITQIANAQDYTEIKGKVLSVTDSSEIIGAHIYIENTSIGTITNSEGIYNIKVTSNVTNNQIKISSIGYKSALINIDLPKDSIQQIIYITPDIITLNEFIVYPTDIIKEIFKGALKKVKTHYLNTPVKLNVFYRELLKQDSDYVRLADAVMDVYQDNFYGNDVNNRVVKLIESRVTDDMLRNNLVYKESPARLINSIRPLKLTPIFFEEHTFKMKTTNIDTSLVYAISFKPKNTLKKVSIEGTIYIRKYDLAIIRCDAKVPEKYLKYFPEREINIKYKGKKKRVKVNQIEEFFSTSFFEYKGHWYIRNTSINKTYQLTSGQEGINIFINKDAQLVVYDLKVENVITPPSKYHMKYDKPISPTKPYNKQFWDSFNVLDYTTLEKGIKKSLEQGRTLDKQFIKKEKH